MAGQVFGLADPKAGREEFNPNFVERIRKMEFPQLMFLPARAGLLDVDSLLRLNELQSVFRLTLIRLSTHWEMKLPPSSAVSCSISSLARAPAYTRSFESFSSTASPK